MADIGVELLYTPTYSPDLNPIEECFSKIKHFVNEDLVGQVEHNIKVSVMNAVTKITPLDMQGYYRHTGYLCMNKLLCLLLCSAVSELVPIDNSFEK